MFVQQSRPLACKDFVNNYTTYLWDQSPLVCRKVKGWWVGKSKRKSSKCNSDAAVLAKSRKYKIDKKVGSNVYYDTFPFPEVNTGD
jgi:hypothetical protein